MPGHKGRTKPRNPNEKRGSKPGERRGGRKPLTPNKPKIAWNKTINLSGCTPLEFMLNIMQNEPPTDATPEIKIAWFQLRFEAAKSAAPYVHPRAIDKAGLPSDAAEFARRVREAAAAMDTSVGSGEMLDQNESALEPGLKDGRSATASTDTGTVVKH